MVMAKACDELSNNIPGKTALAILAFGRALRALPMTLCNNGGYDSQELVQELKVKINQGSKNAGLDMYNGCVGNMQELGVTECFRVKE